MLNIMKEKEYGVLFVAKAEGLDYEKLENDLIHFNNCLKELHYADDIKVTASFYSNKSIVITLNTKDKRFSIDLMNFVVKDDMFYRYKVLALNIFNELLAVLKLYPKFDVAGYESVNHDTETDHIYYCLKTLKYFI